MRRLPAALLIVSLAGITAVAGQDEEKKLTFGGEIRLRGYDMQNMFFMDDDNHADSYSVFRYRADLQADVTMNRGITGRIRLRNQNFGEGLSFSEDNKSNKVFLDQAWIRVENLFDLPLTLKAGRQNLMYGSGFVLFDGQSQFASTSTYFDGIKLQWNLSGRWAVDTLYFKDQENLRDNAAGDDITLSGLYVSGGLKHGPDKLEAYLLNRNDQTLGKDVLMLGLHLADRFDSGLDYSAEVAKQGGDWNATTEQDGLGTKLELGYTFTACPVKPRLFAGHVSMSGDDPATGENERWDVFYGGWPQFGDLLAWKYVNIGPDNSIATYDTGYADGSSTPGEVVYSNLEMVTLGLTANPNDALSVRLSVSDMSVHESTTGDTGFGNYYQLNATYRYTGKLSFGIYIAMIDPGGSFGLGADPATEIYGEMKLSF